ncbi:conjugal transfer protein TraN [Methylobacter sp. YRD-M1]|uniref:conjugal transfer protein TraN n=1 Tax=Methylobacter sp. YRD-M1 TaxID=2911520 RepID=UPI00227AE2C4|nr:conjugal transfer protein TraN [Methylobacter sp. YRD-M1]WAK04480.1 conjugal transfer protein TraN [Methylobacter sp. YRD-M1]
MQKIRKAVAEILIFCIFHNSVAVFYLAARVAFFTPFPAFADAFMDKAAEGEAFGGTLMSEFTIPNVDASSGEITLTNGQVAGQKLQQNEMFQEIQPGSMDAAVEAYGNSAAQGTYVNNTVSALSTGSSTHAYAYQTLMGANTAMPNIYNDPIWQQSDAVLSRQSPLIDDMFSGCTKTTSWAETSCPIHVEDLRTCKKVLGNETCKVTRAVSYTPVMGFGSGDGKIANCGSGCTNLIVGPDTNNTLEGECAFYTWNASYVVLRPEAITQVTIDSVKYDDYTRIYVNDTLVYTGGTGWGGSSCDLGQNWVEYPGTDITAAFKNAAQGGTVVVRQETLVGGLGEAAATLKVISSSDLSEQFIDQPPGCRERVFKAWPPIWSPPIWSSTGSLNDQASTDWWQCLDASNDRAVGPITIIPQEYGALAGPILPDPPASPPAPICYQAESRVPSTHVVEPCYTDYKGYEICPEYDYPLSAHDTCESLASNPYCAYVQEQCAKDDNGNDRIDAITGACKEFIVTYDCGTDHEAACDLSNDGEKTICDAQIRCMGGECVDPPQESNEDFIKAATALQTLNEAQKAKDCDPASGECKLFKGEAMWCQMADLSILGNVDCCNMPIQGSWIDYIWLAKNTWDMADTSVEIYEFGLANAGTEAASGAWQLLANGTVFQAPVNMIADTYTAITQPFSSMYDSVLSMMGEDMVTNLSMEAIKSQVAQWLGEWIASTFGETAASTLLSATAGTGSAAGTTVYSMGGSLLSSIMTVVGIIYAIYQIAKMVVQLIFACTEEEMELAMLKDQKMCTKPDEIGTYCSAETFFGCVAEKQAYCCFTSPFARVFQEQARKQLNTSFGKPREPSCDGFTIDQVASLDFDQMDFGEWINMLKVANIMPLNGTVAESLYSSGTVTTGNLPNTQTNNVLDRLNTQTQETNIDAQRQYLLDHM